MREGIRTAGGVAFEFPVHPIQETGKRPTAFLDRNLAYLGLVEVLYGYPLDGVVLTTGCDKTTPACIMAAATVNIPAIVLSGGPMLNAYGNDGRRLGSGTAIWQARQDHAAGKIDFQQFIDIVAASAPSAGHCNTMGTASTMNAMAEALGMSLPGCAAIPAPYRERGQIAYETGVRAVEIVREDLKPSDILTRAAFENAIVACSAIGGSTNAPIYLVAIARHIGVELSVEDWEKFGYDVPLLVNMQPAGEYLGEEYYRAGGLPAVMQGLAAHILSVQEEDVEQAIPQLRAFITQRVLHQLEARPPLRIKRHQLAVDDTGLCDGAQRLCNAGVAGSHLNAITREEPHRAAPYFGDEAEAVPLGFVQPVLAIERLIDKCGEHRPVFFFHALCASLGGEVRNWRRSPQLLRIGMSFGDRGPGSDSTNA